MLRSAFVSLFWAIITERRKKGVYTLLQLAKKLGTNKAEVSRWFRGEPNWTVGTIANIANALNVELRIEAVDRDSGEVFTPAGIQVSAARHRPQKETSAESLPKGTLKLTRVPQGSTSESAKVSMVA
jgi:transcriptional regulator with XRE-family HTH domain